MTKIKVSFEYDRELAAVLGLLRPAIKSCKVPKVQQGRYKKAYIELQEEQGGRDPPSPNRTNRTP